MPRVTPGFSSLPLRERLRLRASFTASVRTFFVDRGYLEVETPVLVRSPGIDAHIEAISTGDGMFLVTSPELQMKRLLADGCGRIFQIGHAFRKGELGHLHNPEFTLLEWYAPGDNYHGLMTLAEELVTTVQNDFDEEWEGAHLPWARPFARLTVDQIFERRAGWWPSREFSEERFFLDLVERVEPSLAKMGAVFLHDFPAATASLARLKPDDPSVAERCELYLDGVEIMNGFTELTDHLEQAERFKRYNREREALGKGGYPVDRRFLEALESGLPASAGCALGMDRLFMVLAGAHNIDEVLAYSFPRL